MTKESGSKEYKIWAVIEEHDEDTDTYTDISEPAMLGAFDNEAEAFAYLNSLDMYPKQEVETEDKP